MAMDIYAFGMAALESAAIDIKLAQTGAAGPAGGPTEGGSSAASSTGLATYSIVFSFLSVNQTTPVWVTDP